MPRRDRDDDRTFYTTGSGSPPSRYYEEDRARVRVRDREDSDSRLPSFMRDDRAREDNAGPLVLRRGRSPSPMVRFREERIVHRARSETPPRPSVPPPPPARTEQRVYIDRIRSPSRERIRIQSPSPAPVKRAVSRTRIVERERGRSPSPRPERERERIRIIERSRSRDRIPSPSPSPPPPPTVVRGPTIEREVITHYRDIDHGVVKAPSPRPVVRRARSIERDTEIDISRSRDRTEVDIRRRETSRARRSPSHERMSGALVVSKPASARPKVYYDEGVVVEDRHRLRVDIEDRNRSTSFSHEHSHGSGSRHRRAHSAVPVRRPGYADEAEEITSQIESRGRMGEAYNGATRDWTIVDVPPGTERVRMDGVGGGSADVTWQRYNGVRRAKFIPERDAVSDSGALVLASSKTASPSTSATSVDRLSVQIVDKRHDVDIETDRRVAKGRKRSDDMWTEITKDLVTREAIEECGYEYEETEWFFYVMQYLRYEDVVELIEISDDIRRHRRRHLRDIEWERDRQWHHDHRHYHHDGRRHRRRDKYDDEVIVDREVVYEQRPPRGYC